MNRRKKIVSLLMTFLMALGFCAATALAADEMVPVYINVPDGWEAPCLWAWDDDGKGAFAAWPGGEAEADANNPGWYCCWLPDWATNVILNANEGTIQTSDYKVEGRAVWLMVTDNGETVEISYDALTAGEPPAYVEKITIHARVPNGWNEANLWAWSHPDGTNAFAAWPGQPMKAGDDGWYTTQAPSWINSIIINAGADNPQTTDLTVEPSELWVLVADDGSAEVFYENPALAGAGAITIRAKVPADWADPSLWAWSHPDGTNAFAAWPGQPLAEGADGWYTGSAPDWINSVIVNANGGTVQTGDMRLEEAGDIWIVVRSGEDYALSYSEPAEDAAAPDVTPEDTPVPMPKPAPDPAAYLIGAIIIVVIAAVVVTVVVRRKKAGK